MNKLTLHWSIRNKLFLESNIGGRTSSENTSYVDVVDLKREQWLFRTIVLQLRAVQPPATRRRKYERLDERLVRLVSEYDATKVLEFLNSFAHNLELFV